MILFIFRFELIIKLWFNHLKITWPLVLMYLSAISLIVGSVKISFLPSANGPQVSYVLAYVFNLFPSSVLNIIN